MACRRACEPSARGGAGSPTPPWSPASSRRGGGGPPAPCLSDAALITGIVALSLRGPHDSHILPGAVWSLVLALPLLARRRWPVAVFGAIAAIAFAQWLGDVRAFGDCAL